VLAKNREDFTFNSFIGIRIRENEAEQKQQKICSVVAGYRCLYHKVQHGYKVRVKLKVKLKLFLCLTRQHAMKTYGEMKV
jgi:hypothetical protein